MSYQPQWSGKRDEVLAMALKVQIEHPDAWNEVKVHGQTSRRYINLVSMACIANGIPAGVNLKRGGPQESIDALAFPNASGAPDSTGKYPGVEIIDIIGGAEGPTPSLTWGDVTQITIDTGNKGGWKAGSLSPTPGPQPPMPTQPPGREEALDEMKWLDAYYAAPEGLQRPNGLSLNGKPDFEGIAAWYLDVYQRERMSMKSRAESRAAYVGKIRDSNEWKQKHPGEQP